MPRSEVRQTIDALRTAFADRPFTVAAAAVLGIGPRRLQRMADTGLLQRVTRGTYALAGDPFVALRERTRMLRARGVAAAVGGRTAALAWGIPEFGANGRLAPAPPTLLVPPGARIRRGLRGGFDIREADLRPEDVTEIAGVPITTPLRTAVDVARQLGRTRASTLVPLCGGVRAEIGRRVFGQVTASSHALTEAAREPALRMAVHADLKELVGRQPAYGLHWTRRVLMDIEPLIETAAECLAWSEFTMADLPRPVPQALVRGISGRTYRSDFLVGGRVIVEVDGAVKYADQTPWQEKQRQADLEAAGYWVVRCTWEELLHHPERIIARIRLALSRSAA